MIKGQIVEGQGLWRAGFHISGIYSTYGIGLMSGLVDVLDVVWVDSSDAVMFVIRDKDTSETLFRKGKLRGDKIRAYQSSGQPIMVQRTK